MFLAMRRRRSSGRRGASQVAPCRARAATTGRDPLVHPFAQHAAPAGRGTPSLLTVRPNTPKIEGGRSQGLLQLIEDGIHLVVAALLVVLAGLLTVGVVHDVIRSIQGPYHEETVVLSALDNGLVLFIVAELLHTVRLTVRNQTLDAEPFLVVGLIAGIRNGHRDGRGGEILPVERRGDRAAGPGGADPRDGDSGVRAAALHAAGATTSRSRSRGARRRSRHPPRCARPDPSSSAATAARTRCSSRADPTSRSKGCTAHGHSRGPPRPASAVPPRAAPLGLRSRRQRPPARHCCRCPCLVRSASPTG
ncbi:phosphate-starvation-inducible PsiE family protein [Kitasatospora sp. NPDC051914]|uniref:phosphate-starvation-inducible PsiE family protein n=1 Tax=Kitasatospora sp. NPDC051914 TaxID=3154945 RepID=UPI00343CD99D